MARNTIVDVRKKVNQLNGMSCWTDSVELSFNAWGAGQNKYQLIDKDTGRTYGPVCIGASEFLKALKAFEDGRRLE